MYIKLEYDLALDDANLYSLGMAAEAWPVFYWVVYAAKENHVITRRCNVFASDTAKRLRGGSCSMARSASNNLGLLYMRQIKRWLGQWVWVNQLLIKELIQCDVPGMTNAFNVWYCPFLFVIDPSSHIGRASVYLQSEGPSGHPAYAHAGPYGLAYSQS